MPDIKFSNQYPYTDFHELNLDWVIKEVKYWSTKVGKTIQSIELTGTAGLVDTYTINYSDGTTSTFDVTNGNGIASIAKTGTAGLVDTYTITFQDGSTSTFTVTNGAAAVDPTLMLQDYAADAKAVGDAISISITIESGRYNELDNGAKIASWARLRNDQLIPTAYMSSISLPAGYSMQVHEFDEGKNWISYNNNWITNINSIDLQSNTRFIGLSIRNTATPNADIRGEASTVQSGIVINVISKEAVQYTVYNQLFGVKYVLESGKYNELNNGAKIASAARIRNINLIQVDYISKITLPDEYDMQIHMFDAAGTWLGYFADWTTVFDINHLPDNVKFIGMTIRKTNYPNADITGDISTVESGTEYKTVLGTPADINRNYPDVVTSIVQSRRTKNTSNNNYLTRNKPLTLLHFSDIHQEQTALHDIVNFAKINSTIIDDVICTGDMVGARFQNGMSWFDAVDGSENILLAIGNHDTMNKPSGYDDAYQATLPEIYAQYIGPYFANWGLTSDPSSGITYYYKDYPESKVRLIVLDCMLSLVNAAADNTQYSWFTNVLSDAITSGLYVVIANHCMPPSSTFIASNWTNADWQLSQTYLNARYPQAVDSFINAGGKFVCWISGHAHSDYLLKYVGANADQIAISIDAAGMLNALPYTDVNRQANDRSYNSANVITIDTGAELIKVVKFGANCNYKLIPRHILTIDFNGTIIDQR